jgi:hypothetical protein
MLVKLFVFLLAITIVWILLDTWRLRSEINRARRTRGDFHEHPVSEALLLKNLQDSSEFNFAFRLPSSTNWLYLAISNNGRQRRVHFGTSAVEPIRHS